MMKVKVTKKDSVTEQEEQLDEIFDPATLSLMALIVSALSAVFSGIMPFVKRMGGEVDSADRSIRQALKTLPPQGLQRYETVIASLKEEAEEIRAELETSPSRVAVRPSARMAVKIRDVLTELQAIQNDFAAYLRKNPEAATFMAQGKQALNKAFDDCTNLDIIAMIGSKVDPKGLWNRVIKSSLLGRRIGRDEGKWMRFVDVLSKKVKKGPTAARPGALAP